MRQPGQEPNAQPVIIGRLLLVNPPSSNVRKGEDGILRTRDGTVPAADANVTVNNKALETSNINSDLVARHLDPKRVGALKKFRETGVAIGGPIRESKLWFYTSAREGVNQLYVDGVQWNKLQQPASLLYEPDPNRRISTNDYTRDLTTPLGRPMKLVKEGAKPVAGMVEAVGVTASEQQVCALCCCTLGNPQANAGTTANDENVFVCK